LPAQALEVSEDDLIAMLNSSQHIAQGRPEKKIQVHRQSAAEIFFTRTFDCKAHHSVPAYRQGEAIR
jgi:hypothetical protein